jgi:hypothetical protein
MYINVKTPLPSFIPSDSPLSARMNALLQSCLNRLNSIPVENDHIICMEVTDKKMVWSLNEDNEVDFIEHEGSWSLIVAKSKGAGFGIGLRHGENLMILQSHREHVPTIDEIAQYVNFVPKTYAVYDAMDGRISICHPANPRVPMSSGLVQLDRLM